MKINLREVPFSTRGSYMAFSYLEGEFQKQTVEKGLYFRSIHGSSKTSLAARVVPVFEGKELSYTYEATPGELKIKTEKGWAGITFADADTVVLAGEVALKFVFTTGGQEFTFAQPWRSGEREFYLVNAFAQNCRYLFREQSGNMQLLQEWNVSTADFCEIILGDTEYYTGVIKEDYEDWSDGKEVYDYQEEVQKQQKAFADFYASMPSIPEEYKEAGEIAAYVDWASIVKPCGILKREAMLMSKNWMCNIWSWDHCFNALALAYHHPKEAWDQFMVMFDFQTASGRIPDSVNDMKIVNNYCKPPIHGWTLKKLQKIMTITRDQLADAYEKLSKWTNWWLNCRDENGDGLCEYTHGNDSGWDNATVFSLLPPVTSPDLAGFLILQMDALKEAAEALGYQADAEIWRRRADQMLQNMTEQLFEKHQPQALAGFEKQKVENNSLLLYLPVVLGNRLPEKIRRELVQVLKGETFQTAFGLATESPQSEQYEADGYWRGPIWAPSTMLILDGMAECGEMEFVVQMTRRFCQMVQTSGCAENFNALTGEGLRDRAYTWTASAMLVMAHEYLM